MLTSIDGAGLRLARLARSLSQSDLAAAAGVTRQAVAGIEAGKWDPSLKVALALGSALGMTVEELFGPHRSQAAVPVVALEPSVSCERLGTAQVGGRTVAFPLAGSAASHWGFLAASATRVPGHRGGPGSYMATPLAPARPTLLVAGCDPALPLLGEPLARLDPPIGFAWWPCGSQRALKLAADGLVHAAGAHLSDGRGGYNKAAARDTVPAPGAEVIGFADWREGMSLSPSVDEGIGDLAKLAEAELPIVNREPGSEARRLLDRELGRLGVESCTLRGYGTKALGHLQVASSVASGVVAAGIASEAAAISFGLRFVPMAEERYDLVVPRQLLGSVEVQGLLRALASPWLRTQLAGLPGYGVERCGQPVDSF
ncbi:MAG: helix-turn-helix domain-containing protein [Actinomycetota bacterium]|nr:helix-turn-helix domain-containing protein [Actinomycetota bacterium]